MSDEGQAAEVATTTSTSTGDGDAELAGREIAENEVLEAIADDGVFWPGGFGRGPGRLSGD